MEKRLFGHRVATRKKFNELHGENTEDQRCRGADPGEEIGRVERLLRYRGSLQHLHSGSIFGLARFELRQTLDCAAVQLFEMGQILLHCLVLVEPRCECLRGLFVAVQLLLEPLGCLARAGQFLLRLGEGCALAGRAFGSHLLFEVRQAAAQRLGRRIQIQILRREAKLELVQLLAQLRAAFFDIRERRIVLGAAEHLAGRNGVAHRAEVAFGGRHVGVCVIERLTETLHG